MKRKTKTNRKKRRGLSGVSQRSRVRSYAKTTSVNLIDTGKQALSLGAGLLIGTVARGVANKVMGDKSPKLITDLVITGGGAFLASQSQSKYVKNVGLGVATNGVFGIIKNATGKDLLTDGLSGLGLGEIFDLNGVGEVGYIPMINLDNVEALPVAGVGEVGEVGEVNSIQDAEIVQIL
ncbi:MAG: hypothetical protein SNJ71_00280 [Bacteroidales bacterium]